MAPVQCYRSRLEFEYARCHDQRRKYILVLGRQPRWWETETEEDSRVSLFDQSHLILAQKFRRSPEPMGEKVSIRCKIKMCKE